MTAMQFEIGDWIKQEAWDKFYKVVDIMPLEIKLLDEINIQGHWYPKVLDGSKKWIKKEKEQMKQKIDMQKKYRTVDGKYSVRILCTDAKGDDLGPVIALYNVGRYEAPIRLSIYGEESNEYQVIEEIPKVDWSKIAVDTPILIKGVYKRHFHRYLPGKVQFYPLGKTSFTVEERDYYTCNTIVPESEVTLVK